MTEGAESARPGARMTLVPAQLVCRVEDGETLLEAAKRSGIALRSACRNGVCEICAGQVKQGQAFDSRRREVLQEGATVLLCRAEARGDLVIHVDNLMAAGSHAVESVTAKVVELTALNHDVYRVRLRLPPGRGVPFHAGQYLAIVLPGAEPVWFSIASAPGADTLELHIQASSDWATAQNIMDYLRAEGRVPLQLPFGQACLAQRPQRELLLVAAGTGFSQMKSILEYLAESDQELTALAGRPPITLFWGVRRQDDMYLRSLPEQWQKEWPGFHFVPVLSNDADSEWQGHHERLAQAVLAGGFDLSNLTVMASGSPVMVYTLMDALVAAGLPPEQFFSDVLEYAPR